MLYIAINDMEYFYYNLLRMFHACIPLYIVSEQHIFSIIVVIFVYKLINVSRNDVSVLLLFSINVHTET